MRWDEHENLQISSAILKCNIYSCIVSMRMVEAEEEDQPTTLAKSQTDDTYRKQGSNASLGSYPSANWRNDRDWLQAFFDRVRQRVHQTIEYARVKVFPSKQEIYLRDGTSMYSGRCDSRGEKSNCRCPVDQFHNWPMEHWCNESSALLTAHRSTDSFERKLAVLHAQTFPGTHTSDVICAKYAEMLERWEIKKEQLHL